MGRYIKKRQKTLGQPPGTLVYIGEKKIEKTVTIPEEDVQLVAQQAKVSLDKARSVLEQTKGDLAQAILLLTQT